MGPDEPGSEKVGSDAGLRPAGSADEAENGADGGHGADEASLQPRLHRGHLRAEGPACGLTDGYSSGVAEGSTTRSMVKRRWSTFPKATSTASSRESKRSMLARISRMSLRISRMSARTSSTRAFTPAICAESKPASAKPVPTMVPMIAFVSVLTAAGSVTHPWPGYGRRRLHYLLGLVRMRRASPNVSACCPSADGASTRPVRSSARPATRESRAGPS